MKIASATLQMASSHSQTQQHEIRESLRSWVGNRRPDFENAQRGRLSAPPPTVTLSDAGKTTQSAEAQAIENSREAVDKDPMLQIIRAMVAALTGREVKVFDASELDVQTTEPPPPPADNLPAAARASGFGVEYDRHESYSESEATRFAANGIIRTADGQEISFSLSLSMTRAYHEESDVSIRLGDARQKKDPLVLNFNGTASELDSRRFSFDLDADGSTEEINFVKGGSGFLALDRNQDGKINNGSELFGARSGDGFAELASLDGDNNGWIDENDAAFAELRVWTKDGEGHDHLASLAESNVGAISLARIGTPFDLKTASNALLGQVRSSGVFLQEDGKAGTIQQIDLTV